MYIPVCKCISWYITKYKTCFVYILMLYIMFMYKQWIYYILQVSGAGAATLKNLQLLLPVTKLMTVTAGPTTVRIPTTRSFTSGQMRRQWADFLRRFEAKEQRGYPALDRMLSRLPIPGKVDQRGLSVSDAIDAGMLPRMDEEEARPEFKPAEIANDLHGQIRYIHGIL